MDTSTHLMVDAVSICIGGLLGAFMAWLFDRERAKRYKARDESYARQRAELKAEREELAKWRNQLRGAADDAHIIAHTAVELADTDPRVRAINEWPEPADIEDNSDTIVWGYDPAGGMEPASSALRFVVAPEGAEAGRPGQELLGDYQELGYVDETSTETVVRMPPMTVEDIELITKYGRDDTILIDGKAAPGLVAGLFPVVNEDDLRRLAESDE